MKKFLASCVILTAFLGNNVFADKKGGGQYGGGGQGK
jgi:hypothetical protein